MTLYLADYATYQAGISLSTLKSAGYRIINFKISHGLGQKSVATNLPTLIGQARSLGLDVCTFHWLDNSATGTQQANYALSRLNALGLDMVGHVCDCESNATQQIFRDYMTVMTKALRRPVGLYTGDWWWTAPGRKWAGAPLTPYLHAAPNQGYLPAYPGDTSAHWKAGYGGWPNLSIMQHRVGKIAGVAVSQSAIRDPAVWSALTGGGPMAWTLIPAAKSLFKEFNLLAPKRDKASDGAVGNLAHQEGTSDHNPDETGNTGSASDTDKINEVHAIDVDNSGPWPTGKNMEWSVQTILSRCRAKTEKRLRYVIYNKRIWSASNGWKQAGYSGANPHDHHAHFSFVYGSGSGASNPENDISPWGLVTTTTTPPPTPEEDDVKPEDLPKIAAAVWAMRFSDPYDKTVPQRQLAANVWLRYSADQGRQNAGLAALRELLVQAQGADTSRDEIQAALNEALDKIDELLAGGIDEPEEDQPLPDEPVPQDAR
jgi:Glycosyl hydrolases family 25